MFNNIPDIDDLLEVLRSRGITLSLNEETGKITPHCTEAIPDELRDVMAGLKPELTQYLRERNWPQNQEKCRRNLEAFYFALTAWGAVEPAGALCQCIKGTQRLLRAVDARDIQEVAKVNLDLADAMESWASMRFPPVPVDMAGMMRKVDEDVKEREAEVLPGQRDLFGAVHWGPVETKKKKKR